MTETPDKRKLNELRVVDLKHELEKRGKDGSGVKNVLLEKLTQALRDEGQDPETMEFEIVLSKTPAKKGKATAGGKTDEESNTMDTTLERGGEGVENIKQETASDDVVKDVEVAEKDEISKEKEEVADITDMSASQISPKDEPLEEPQQQSVNGQDNEEFVKPAEIVPAAAKPVAADNAIKVGDMKEDSKETDNEDSLNLTIGEEDEKLLHDSNLEVEQKEEAETEEKTQSSETASDILEETKRIDEKKEGKSEKSAAASNTEKDGASKTAASSSSATASSARTGGEKAAKPTPPTGGATGGGGGDEKVKTKPNSGSAAAGSNGPASVSRNLWVSRLSSLTRATDLKQIFSKYGKVIGAKVVTNSRTPGTRCYGYVTMASAKDATECIEHLHRTELHGRLISVERAKSELGPARQSGATVADSSTKSTTSSNNTTSSSSSTVTGSSSNKGASVSTSKGANNTAGGSKIDSAKPKAATANDEKKKNGDASTGAASASGEKERKGSAQRETTKPRPSQPFADSKRRQGGAAVGGEKPMRSVSSNAKSGDAQHAAGGRSVDRGRTSRDRRSTTHGSSSLRADPDRRRSRESGRAVEQSRDSRDVLSLQKIREERERHRLQARERTLREEERRRREIRARQREEEERLQREREKLAAERERIDKEKAELLRIVRERQKLEREKIELEHLELKRQQRKIEEAKRSLKRPSTDRYDDDRKRPAPDRRVEAPPPPRFDSSISTSSGRSNYDRLASSEKKGRLDEYPAPSKRDDFRRDSFKRGSDDYKRPSGDDYKRPSGDDYKRGADDFKRDSRDDYKSSSGRTGDDYGKRDSGYNKRDLDRPIASSYDGRGSGGVGGGGLLSQSLSKDSRYNDRSSDYRGGASGTGSGGGGGGGGGGGLNGGSGGAGGRGGTDDRDRNNSSSSRYSDRTGGGSAGNAGGGNWHSNSGMSQIGAISALGNWGDKTNDGSSGGGGGGGGWRNMDNGQDRYDRTYNERKPLQISSGGGGGGGGGGFIEQSRPNQFMGSGGGSGGRQQDRYGQSVSSRFDNGRY